MIRTVVKEKVLIVAVDLGKWGIRKVHPRGSLPEVNPIVPRDVDILDGVFEAVVVMFYRGRI